ncbi:uncharacterized protein [Macrobrachium rosenbergii]|uniref:uncharacterized protein isoform X2 n=1 Tax=Macrobrachium rosenbergii TaxID=79674 RepID=UPI0034D4B414
MVVLHCAIRAGIVEEQRDSTFYCNTCDTTLISKDTVKAHLRSKVHSENSIGYNCSPRGTTVQVYNDPELQRHAATADSVVTSGTPAVAFQKDTIPAFLSAHEAPGTSNRHVPDPRPTQSARSKKRGKKRVCDETDNALRRALRQVRELSSSDEERNTETDFANVVENDLSQMSDENKTYAQKLISDILFLGKMGKLSSSYKIIE